MIKLIITALLVFSGISNATTRNIVPRADDEGNLGLSTITWHGVYASKFYGDGSSLTGLPSHVVDLSTYAVKADVAASTIASGKLILALRALSVSTKAALDMSSSNRV